MSSPPPPPSRPSGPKQMPSDWCGADLASVRVQLDVAKRELSARGWLIASVRLRGSTSATAATTSARPRCAPRRGAARGGCEACVCGGGRAGGVARCGAAPTRRGEVGSEATREALRLARREVRPAKAQEETESALRTAQRNLDELKAQLRQQALAQGKHEAGVEELEGKGRQHQQQR